MSTTERSARFSVAGFSVAGFSVAGFSVAGFSVAGFSVAGFSVTGVFFGIRNSMFRWSICAQRFCCHDWIFQLKVVATQRVIHG
jgi:hypothetical protein